MITTATTKVIGGVATTIGLAMIGRSIFQQQKEHNRHRQHQRRQNQKNTTAKVRNEKVRAAPVVEKAMVAHSVAPSFIGIMIAHWLDLTRQAAITSTSGQDQIL